MSIESIYSVCKIQNPPLEFSECNEILTLLHTEPELYHIAKTNLKEAVEEAIFYIYPDF